MKVIFSGTPFFSKQLAEKFSQHDNTNKYIYLNIKTNIWKRLYFYYQIITADILFVNYVDTYFIKSVDFAMKLNKKVILSWIGNDVLDATPRVKQDLFNKNYINKAIHTTNSTWLQMELKEINIDAKYLTIYMYEEKERNICLPDQFSVLTYVSKGQEQFYGIDTIIKLANNFPEIEFKIAGISEYNNLPSNIKLLGWIDMDKEYENCTVYIRYPVHDGEAHSVLEALSYGKTVLYNRDYPFVNYVTNYSELEIELRSIINQYNNSTLTPNYKGIEHIKNNYNFEKVFEEYKIIFNKISRSK